VNRTLRLFADSADVDAVGPLLADGLVHGVTTNPTILERAGRSVRDIPELYELWRSQGANEIFFQTWGAATADLLANAEPILGLGPQVVVKVPATRAGFAAAAALARQGATVLLTAVYSRGQALAAATLGIRYIAPYLGRLEDAGWDGVEEIAGMQSILTDTGTDVLAASLRTPDAIIALAARGVPYFTAAPAVILALLQHDVSDGSAADFEAAVARGL
jgi:transaldolase